MLPDLLISAFEKAAIHLWTQLLETWGDIVVGIGVGSLSGRIRIQDLYISVSISGGPIPPALSELLDALPLPAKIQVTGRFRLLFGPGAQICASTANGPGTLGAIVGDRH